MADAVMSAAFAAGTFIGGIAMMAEAVRREGRPLTLAGQSPDVVARVPSADRPGWLD